MQFVKYADYAGRDISLLAEEVLRELPDQVVGYMLSKGIRPEKQQWQDVNQAAGLQMVVNV